MRKGVLGNNMEFKVLSYQEEQQLNTKERHTYYEKLRAYATSRKLTNTTPGATTIAPKLKGITNKIAVAVTKAFTSKNVEWICEGNKALPDGPIIFGHTHQGILDGFVWIPNLDRHCLILHGAETNKLLLLCQINTGLILVKRGNKENNQNAKMDMIHLLLKGHSIAYFPEGVWNLSPNKLHLPMSFGLIDVAKKAQAPIIPVAHEFTYANIKGKQVIVKVHTKYGAPIYVGEGDSLIEKLQEYEDAIATMRYELIEAKGIHKRKDISNIEYITWIQDSIKNLALGKLDINFERRQVFGGNDDFYKFHHINDVPFNENGVLLETEEVRRLKMINKIHRI